MRCRACNKEMFLRTSQKKLIPIDLETWTEGENEFNPAKHVTHFATCPEAERFRKKEKEKKGGGK